METKIFRVVRQGEPVQVPCKSSDRLMWKCSITLRELGGMKADEYVATMLGSDAQCDVASASAPSSGVSASAPPPASAGSVSLSPLSDSNIIFSHRLFSTEGRLERVRALLLDYIQNAEPDTFMQSPRCQLLPGCLHEWYFVLMAIRQSGVANADMKDSHFVRQMHVWFPEFIPVKHGQDPKGVMRRYAKAISAERGHWVQDAGHTEVAVKDMLSHAHSRGIFNPGSTSRIIAATRGLFVGLKKLREELGR